ncbi:unnamed protein product [Bursaphelenchus okinawaensis]|uniref:SS18 N-terminal domain-containing protein n=1 Tax=Bursaphelenchus okinawaensis TaxID=465554 RepID=A0A811JU34_9BILA|nr:unnamed protein product [Bursaphelenchus okinawaensis]CAG9082634.1 unnamed protein product [Bursaphelenchus okinawaensis]
MSVARIPEAAKGASEGQTSVQKMLVENSQLIETIAEYQRMGKLEDATKYQELLHKNLMFLSNLVDPQLNIQVQEVAIPQSVQQHEPISVNVEQHPGHIPPQPNKPQQAQYYSPNYPPQQQRTPRMT